MPSGPTVVPSSPPVVISNPASSHVRWADVARPKPTPNLCPNRPPPLARDKLRKIQEACADEVNINGSDIAKRSADLSLCLTGRLVADENTIKELRENLAELWSLSSPCHVTELGALKSSFQSALESEATALRAGLTHCLKLHINKIVIETDSLTLLQMINNTSRCPWQLRTMLLDLKDLLDKFDNFVLNHVSRTLNTVADLLAQLGRNSANDTFWETVPPQAISNALYLDSMGLTPD